MSVQRVLVAYASRSGSTAGIGEEIADALRGTGLFVDTRQAGDVGDLGPYDAVVLGSGVFLPRRGSDGGGFLVRHAEALASRAVWLFCVGPIGRGRGGDGGPAVQGDCSVFEVARAVGARGCEAFGTPLPGPFDDPMEQLTPVDLPRVREWAREIASALAASTRAVTPPEPAATTGGRQQARRCRRAAAG